MLRRIKICLFSFIFINQATFAVLPDFGISAASCCIYATMSFLCCAKCADLCCSAHGYTKLRAEIATINDNISRINQNLVNLTAPQIQRMSHSNSRNETPPSLQQLKIP